MAHIEAITHSHHIGTSGENLHVCGHSLPGAHYCSAVTCLLVRRWEFVIPKANCLTIALNVCGQILATPETVKQKSCHSELHTYSTAYSHEQLSHCFGVVHHDGFNGPVQHSDLLGPLLLLVLQNVLPE